MKFHKLPVQLYDDKRLAASDINIMSLLLTYAQFAEDKQTIELSVTDIFEKVKGFFSERTIKRSLKRLAEYNYIQVTKDTTHTNKYKVLFNDKPIIQQTTNTGADPDVEKYKVLINKF